MDRQKVYIDKNTDYDKALAIVNSMGLEVIEGVPEDFSVGPVLVFGDEGLTLFDGERSMCGDFTKMLPRLKKNKLSSEMLFKATRLKGFEGIPTAVDATAGMGEDSLILAAAGFKVILFELDPVIAALLRDTIRRSKDIPELKDIVERMELIQGDSIKALNNMFEAPEVVLLDPMFPERQKSGLIKKKFQLLQQLERPCDKEEELLQAAINSKPRKIVIKRPAKGPNLAGKKPDYTIDGKAIRYDCLVFPQNY